MCLFSEEWLPSDHSSIKVVQCCTDGYPSERFPHLDKGTLNLIHSDQWVLGYLSGQGLSSPISQFGWRARSRKTVGGSKSLPFENE